MIDTKIACQCGNHFKFGMDLVNGRAPDGLICPTCGAPATAACNALVDFLSGKEPAPPSADTRPLKEVRVTCTCGARYKFDLELAELEMPARERIGVDEVLRLRRGRRNACRQGRYGGRCS